MTTETAQAVNWNSAQSHTRQNVATCARCHNCGAPATWEVPFSTTPRYEYYCATCLPEKYLATPIGDVCHNCGADHITWQCPEIRQALFAPDLEPAWKDVALGRELCRMRWRDFSGFVALLSSLTTNEHLVMYAESYVAFIRSYNVASDLTAAQVLETWHRLIGGVAEIRQAA